MQKILSDYTHTWKIISIIAMVVGSVSLVVFSFQQRTPILEAITGHKLYVKTYAIGSPSSETKEQLTKFVDVHPLVVAISIGKANFEMNTREPTFRYSKVEEISVAWARTAGVESPLFGEDTVQNGRVVELINGKFVCSPTAEVVGAVLHPIINDYSKLTCSIAIPPGYGDFLGWINIYLESTPTFVQMETLQRIAEKMAKDIYERDVLRRKDGNTGGTSNTLPVN